MTEPAVLLPPAIEATAPSANPNYQRLAEYWAHGEGAAKIRWGIKGDFDRCVRQLTEHAGQDLNPEQVKGLCNHLHQRALGVPPGQEHPKAAVPWNESLHPRQGGKFAPKGQGDKGGKKETREQEIARLRAELAALRKAQRAANKAKPGSFQGHGVIGGVLDRLQKLGALTPEETANLGHGKPGHAVDTGKDGGTGKGGHADLGHGPSRHPPPLPEGGRRLGVKAGDTLSGIAARHGVSLADIMKWNPQIDDPDMIYAGEHINIVPRRKARAAGEETVTLPAVDLVAAGTWQLSSGETTFTSDDLRSAIDASTCRAVGLPVIKLGHVDPRFDGEPAVGRVSNLRLAEGGDSVLQGDLTGMPAWLGKSMASAYPRRSVEGAYDFRCQIGHVHPFVITALALLGVTAPGVGVLNGIEDVQALYEPAASGEPRQTWSLDIPGGPRMNDPKAAKGAIGPEDVRQAYYETQGAGNYSLWITEVNLDDDPSLIVADSGERKTYRVPVSLASGGISFGAPVEVVPAYVEASFAAEASPFLVLAQGQPGAGYDESGLDASWDDLSDIEPWMCELTVQDLAVAAGEAAPAEAAKPKLGSGGRSAAMKAKGMSGALIAWIGRKRWGKGRFQALAAAARKRKHAHAAANHDPFTGKHAHEHPALGAQGGDETHEHPHSHDGDADHAHAHEPKASTEGATEVDLTQEIEAGLRSQLGIEGDLTPEGLLAAATELRKAADAKVHASYKPPEGVIVVAKEAWDGLQARVKQGELAREAQLRGERDQVLDEAVRAGKFSAAKRNFWERLWAADPDGTRAAIGTLQRNAVPMEDIGRPGGGPDDLLDDEYRALFPPVS